jgi:ABC-type dipeptide/oligopeptide/nickel transport system permease subunit
VSARRAGGYFGGFTDTIVSRLTEAIMAFPLILFRSSPASGSATPDADRLGSSCRKIVAVALLIGLFTWFYPRGSCARRC